VFRNGCSPEYYKKKGLKLSQSKLFLIIIVAYTFLACVIGIISFFVSKFVEFLQDRPLKRSEKVNLESHKYDEADVARAKLVIENAKNQNSDIPERINQRRIPKLNSLPELVLKITRGNFDFNRLLIEQRQVKLITLSIAVKSFGVPNDNNQDSRTI
jgi:hypothetical protein